MKRVDSAAGSVLSEQGAGPARVILSGWCARAIRLPSGKLKIVALLLPGDAFGINAGRWAGDSLDVVTLTPVTMGDASALKEIIRFRPPAHARLIEGCEHAQSLEQSYFISQISRLLTHNTYSRLASLLCELSERLGAVMCIGAEIQIPVRQSLIAEMLGVSAVHLNRRLKEMQRAGFVALGRRSIRLLDCGALRAQSETHAAVPTNLQASFNNS